jgi:hypothetical protein
MIVQRRLKMSPTTAPERSRLQFLPLIGTGNRPDQQEIFGCGGNGDASSRPQALDGFELVRLALPNRELF